MILTLVFPEHSPVSRTWYEGNKCQTELLRLSKWLKDSTQTVLIKSYYQGKVSISDHRTTADLPGYVSKMPLSAVLFLGLQPLQTAHILWHQPAGVLFDALPSGVSVVQAGCRTKHSEDQAEPPVAELGKYPLSSGKRVKIIITRRTSAEQLRRPTKSEL